jgi:exo-1,4-beta-D-glucosaminidase
MLNNAWPSLIWHLYSYDLLPAAGYYGSKTSLEQVHVQYSYDDRTVAVVNGTQNPQSGLKIVAKLYDITGTEKFSREASVDVAADGVARSVAIPEPAGISSAYFLNLQLYSPTGQLLSRNFYWLSTKPDELDYAKTEWYYTPQTTFADLSALQDLPKTTVQATLRPIAGSEHEAAYQVALENAGAGVAFLTRLRLVKGKDQKEVLPVFWDDNYICLLPGEKREVTVRLRKSDLDSAQPALLVDGFNVLTAAIHLNMK